MFYEENKSLKGIQVLINIPPLQLFDLLLISQDDRVIINAFRALHSKGKTYTFLNVLVCVHVSMFSLTDLIKITYINKYLRLQPLSFRR